MAVVKSKEYVYEHKINQANDPHRKLEHIREYLLWLSQNDTSKALEVSKDGVLIAKQLNDHYQLNWMKIHHALALADENKFVEAIELFINIDKSYTRLGEKEYALKTKSNIAKIYYDVGLYNQAIFIWKQILNAPRVLINDHFKNIITCNLYSAYQKTFKLNEINPDHLLQIIQYYESNHKTHEAIYPNALLCLAEHYFLNHDFEKTQTICDQGIDISKQHSILKNEYQFCYIKSMSYKETGDDDLFLKHLEITFDLSTSLKTDLLLENLYHELYLIYKKNKDMQKALNFLEKYSEEVIKKQKIKDSFQDSLESFNYLNPKNHELYKNFHSKNLFIYERNIRLYNNKNQLVNINIDNIISIKLTYNYLQINYANNKQVYIKASIMEFMKIIERTYEKNHLFFVNIARSEIVNLYWMTKCDFKKRILYFRVIDKVLEFEVSKRQVSYLKEFLSETN